MPSARTLEAGKAVIKLSIDDKTATGMKAVAKRAEQIGAKMKSVGAQAAAAGGVIVGAFAAAANKFIETGAAIDDMAKRTGFGAESLSKLKFAAEQSGGSMDDIGAAAAGMAKFMLGAERDSAAAVDTLSRLGVTLADLQKLSPEKRFELLAEAISKVSDPTMRAALATKVFGGAGRTLLPLLNEGPAGLAALSAEAQRLGLVMDGEAVAAAAKLDDQLSQLKAQVGAMAIAVGSAVAEPLSKFLTLTSEIFAGLSKWLGVNPGLIEGIGGMGAAAVIAGGGVAALGLALTAVTAHPIVAGMTAIAGAVMGIAYGLSLIENKAGKAIRALEMVGMIDPGASKAWEAFKKFEDAMDFATFAPEMPEFKLPTAPTPLPTAEDLFGGGAKPGNAGASLGSRLIDGVQAAFADAMVSLEAKALRARFDANPAMVRSQQFIGQFKTGREGPVDVKRSDAVLDARLASQQFGGRREELDTLKKIEGHTKKAADKQPGGIAVA